MCETDRIKTWLKYIDEDLERFEGIISDLNRKPMLADNQLKVTRMLCDLQTVSSKLADIVREMDYSIFFYSDWNSNQQVAK